MSTVNKIKEAKKYGRYVVEKLLGEGAMGRVLLARDPVLKRQVAIKVISVERQLDEASRRQYLSRFSLEARLSAQLCHQSIVQVYDAGEEGGIPWIAFQYIDGVTLDKILREKGKLSVKWAIHIAMHVASALQHAHESHIVHRDVKPANIIIDRHGGIAKLADFGVAKVSGASLTCEGTAMGSPGYMSPEQIEGKQLDERSDLFSLGVVLYEMVTGRHPFLRDTVAATAYATIGGAYKPAGIFVRGVPSKLDAIIALCLSPDPDKRVASAEKLSLLLQDIVPAEGSKGSVKDSVARFFAVVRNITGIVDRKKRQAGIKKSSNAFKKKSTGMKIITPTRRRRKRVRLAAIGSIGFAALVIAGSLLFVHQKPAPWFPTGGLDEKHAQLLEKIPAWLEANRLDSAAAAADALAVSEKGAGLGHFLRGIIAFRKGSYDEARLSFEKAEALKVSGNIFRNNRGYLANWYRTSFASRRAPDGVVTLLAKKFSAADDPAIKRAVYEEPYWPRWNALRILQAGGKQVDLVRVFILDLRFAADSRTRVQAVSDLGDLGDRRAIPALRELCGRRASDPLAASAAAKILKEVFHETEQCR